MLKKGFFIFSLFLSWGLICSVGSNASKFALAVYPQGALENKKLNSDLVFEAHKIIHENLSDSRKESHKVTLGWCTSSSSATFVGFLTSSNGDPNFSNLSVVLWQNGNFGIPYRAYLVYNFLDFVPLAGNLLNTQLGCNCDLNVVVRSLPFRRVRVRVNEGWCN